MSSRPPTATRSTPTSPAWPARRRRPGSSRSWRPRPSPAAPAASPAPAGASRSSACMTASPARRSGRSKGASRRPVRPDADAQARPSGAAETRFVMSVLSPIAPPTIPTPPVRPEPVAFHYTQSETFAPLLKQLGVSLLVTTYQANKLLVLRERLGGLSILVRSFERPMGLAVDPRRIALGARDQVWQFRNASDLAPQVEPAGMHDACFIPRSSHVTGDIGIHEVCWAGANADELWAVNTRFSCLCTFSPDYSFVPRWRPPFITALAAEDRCHLNGLAIVDGEPRYATALGQTDTRGGGRGGNASGGAVRVRPGGEGHSRG